MMLDQYLKKEKVERLLFKIRASYAKRRSDKHILSALSAEVKHTQEHGSFEHAKNEENTLSLILPTRKNWCKLKQKDRYSDKECKQKITSIDNNIKSLRKTILHNRRDKPNEKYLEHLDNFIKHEVIGAINNPLFHFTCPDIIAKWSIDSSGKRKFRPVCQFTLRDKIIICLVNKYLTKTFEPYFLNSSFAFRPGSKDSNPGGLMHHNAVKEILEYKKRIGVSHLWVAECDIKKFYDSVNHTVIRKHFNALVSKAEHDTGVPVDRRAVRIFSTYLECYNFVCNVLPKNNDSNYWTQFAQNSDNLKFNWVNDNLIDQGHYKVIDKRSRIGIPQGGALSGLIANLVLNEADKQIEKNCDKHTLYLRYCDDIIILHPEKKGAQKALNTYIKVLGKQKLVYHPFKTIDVNNKKSFWSEKSKCCYRWANNPKKGMEWIGFLGYEIHFNGSVRVRQGSLKKEEEKQKRVVGKILQAIKNGKQRSNDTIIESATHKLTGMSVGRVNLHNYSQVEPKMCWANGFKLLNNNPHAQKQLKSLDFSRQCQINRLKRHLKANASKDNRIRKPPKTKKWFFCQIPGVGQHASEQIREQLKQQGILDASYRIRQTVTKETDIVLTDDLRDLENAIKQLIIFQKNKRPVGFYGKPYSYYYQCLKNNQHML